MTSQFSSIYLHKRVAAVVSSRSLLLGIGNSRSPTVHWKKKLLQDRRNFANISNDESISQQFFNSVAPLINTAAFHVTFHKFCCAVVI